MDAFEQHDGEGTTPEPGDRGSAAPGPPGAFPAGAIHVAIGDGRVVVTLTGEVDAALRSDASRARAATLAAGLPVLVDATDVTFLDSSGVAFLLQLHRAAAEADLEVRLRDPGQTVVDVLRLVGMAHALRVEAPDDGTGAGAVRAAAPA